MQLYAFLCSLFGAGHAFKVEGVPEMSRSADRRVCEGSRVSQGKRGMQGPRPVRVMAGCVALVRVAVGAHRDGGRGM